MNTPPEVGPVVVVAEDNVLIRRAVVQVLTKDGLVVVEAEHAEEALATLNVQAADIDVLFTDINMPGAAMDGLALAHHVRGSWPWIGLLITSGDVIPKMALPADSRFLPKPYAAIHVLTHVRELLAA